jgi:hypothetical protein
MKTQAWGWLVAAVMAAGLNASYHDGAFEWTHQVVDQVKHNSAAVLALASGRADRFLAEARLTADQEEAHSCRWATTLARIQTRAARTENRFAHFQARNAEQEAQFARLEADRARIEAEVAAQTARIRIPNAAFNPVSLPTIDVCPRVHVNLPRMPHVHIPAPDIHIEMPSAGPV